MGKRKGRRTKVPPANPAVRGPELVVMDVPRRDAEILRDCFQLFGSVRSLMRPTAAVI